VDGEHDVFKPPGGEVEEAQMPSVADRAGDGGPQSEIAVAKERNENALMAIDGVEGVAIGRDRIGDAALVIYVREPSVKRQLPSQVEGHAVETVVTGPIDAYKG